MLAKSASSTPLPLSLQIQKSLEFHDSNAKVTKQIYQLQQQQDYFPYVPNRVGVRVLVVEALSEIMSKFLYLNLARQGKEGGLSGC
jgi:hypothetical protein